MAASVVFVHGTGVRGERYAAQSALVRANIRARRPDVQVLPCLWGDALGARLSMDGASLPPDETPVRRSEQHRAEEDWQASLWGLLEADPLHELRAAAVLGRTAPAAGGLVLGEEPAGERLALRSGELTQIPSVRAELTGIGLLEAFAGAVPAVLGSAAAEEALAAAEPGLAEALARAFVAQALRDAAAGERGPVPVVAERRRQLVTLLTEQLDGEDLGIASVGKALARNSAVLAWRWFGAGAVERRRRAVTDAHHPMAGDILLYLSRGEAIRQFIRDCCRDAPGPVILLAHSLGGIACLDLLAEHSLPQVVGLVTVGSQAPFLYELGALPSLPPGAPLPPGVPTWTNFYDPRDLLAYVGGQVFPGRVTDIPVPGGNPFPAAHGDYFGNPVFYDRLCEVLP